jgi:ssDNA-binding Zn-finger/Zn-ribbon topoisomerase 1
MYMLTWLNELTKRAPDDWKCPVCGAGKKLFRQLARKGSAATGQARVDNL